MIADTLRLTDIVVIINCLRQNKEIMLLLAFVC